MSKPTPGSDAAIKAGCTCPVLDNHHGRGFFWGTATVFWIGETCLLHAKRKDADEPINRRRKRRTTPGR
jgi:hypothetical protein